MNKEHTIPTGYNLSFKINGPGAKLSTTHLMWVSEGLKPSPYHKRLATDCLSHGMPEDAHRTTDALTKIKFTLEQAMEAQRGSRCIALLFL
jgi:hypothetical protein